MTVRYWDLAKKMILKVGGLDKAYLKDDSYAYLKYKKDGRIVNVYNNYHIITTVSVELASWLLHHGGMDIGVSGIFKNTTLPEALERMKKIHQEDIESLRKKINAIVTERTVLREESDKIRKKIHDLYEEIYKLDADVQKVQNKLSTHTNTIRDIERGKTIVDEYMRLVSEMQRGGKRKPHRNTRTKL